MHQLAVNGYNIYCQTATVVWIKCPLERAGKAPAEGGKGGREGCCCPQEAKQRTSLDGISQLSFTVATGMAGTEGGSLTGSSNRNDPSG